MAPLGFIVGICSAFLFTSTAASECSSTNRVRCEAPLGKIRNDFDISGDLEYFPIYKLPMNAIDRYCSVGRDVSKCLLQMDCNSTQQSYYMGTVDSVTYLCDDTLQDYKGFHDCISKEFVANKLEKCDKDASEQMRKIIGQDGGSMKDLCGVISVDYDCNHKAVEPTCGSIAADWEVTYTEKNLNPLLNSIGCTGTPRWAIVLILIVVFGLVAGLVVLVFYIKKKRSSASNASLNDFHNVLASPT